ncbi:MAG: hypothetical protein J0H29_22570 [Sphingobacteriales bacterium]|nr:hypothetical protein [Sphingobacteriales bacterium]OJY92566.1 MAG: hypothetical protein BGP14_15440 [Sphingobacteriales bacterium 44-15]
MMAKQQQQLSPENYIRQRSRSLPISDCYINKGREDSGIAQVMVIRKHSNGNSTFCLYIVDLYCLGIKETTFRFNQTEKELEEVFESFKDTFDIEQVDYTLAHNIIYAALAYADELGFKPHKDFTQITSYFLEEDTEDIALIEIECGKNGKPLYAPGPYDSAAKVRQIINQLEKVTGKGGYDYIVSDNAF